MLVDTDVLVDYLRGRELVRSRLHQASQAKRLQTTVINQFELLAGVRQPEQERATRELLETLDIVSPNPEAAGTAGNLRRDLFIAGFDIDMGDSLIAGIALAHNLPLLTRNRKHFERVPNLKLIDLEYYQ